jgi:hypothetical protein
LDEEEATTGWRSAGASLLLASIGSTGTVRFSSSSQAGAAALAEDKDRLALYARAAAWVAV